MNNQKVYVVTNVDMGWDCVIGVYFADSKESLIEHLGDNYDPDTDIIHTEKLTIVKTKSDIRNDKITDLGIKDKIGKSSWVCNECNFKDYTDAVTEEELDKWLQCSNCGGCEFHLEK